MNLKIFFYLCPAVVKLSGMQNDNRPHWLLGAFLLAKHWLYLYTLKLETFKNLYNGIRKQHYGNLCWHAKR